MEHRRPLTVGRAPGQLERDDREPGDVVDAVPRFPAGNHAVGVLDDPHVVDQSPQMIRSDRRELELDDRDRLLPRPRQGGLLQHDGRLGCDRRPGEIGSYPPCLRACCGK